MNCKKCGATIRQGTNVCEKCGTVDGKAVANSSTKTFCINCGSAIEGGAEKCTKCGTAAESPVITASTNGVGSDKMAFQDNKSNNGSICILVGTLLDIIGVILVFYGNNKAHDMMSQFQSYITSGSSNNGTTIMTVGVVMIVIGAILNIYGSMKNKKK